MPRLILVLLTLCLVSCAPAPDDADLTGTWIHSTSRIQTDPDTGRSRELLRRDQITFDDDGTYRRTFASTLPGEEAEYTHTGSWRIAGRKLRLTFAREDGSPGLFKSRLELVDEYSLRLGRRWYEKDGRPRTRPPGRE